MSAAQMGMVMLVVIAVLGSAISILDHRALMGADKQVKPNTDDSDITPAP